LRVGQLELLVEQARVDLDVARLVHHLGRRVELGVDAGHLLHDLGRAQQGALLAVHELRELLGLQVPSQVGALLRRHPVPDVGAEDRDLLVGQLLRVLGIEVERPVDPRVAVPLPLLALLVQVQQRGAAVLVFPAHERVEAARDDPFGRIDRHGVALFGGHRAASCGQDGIAC
jgi:hypothetical protein